jgi:hypothetical protein
MVLGRMGLLDDAIREHLELKRLKGTDPGDLAREEREALGEGGPPEQADASAYEEDRRRAHAEPPGPDEDLHGHTTEQGGSPAPVAAAQETIELDMESVLASSPRSIAEQASSEDEEAAVAPPAHAPEPEDSLEWEMPAEQEPNEPGREPDGHSEDEPVEDVLEETPDFLRETPEQERLWFEQRPPRDFDFNE